MNVIGTGFYSQLTRLEVPWPHYLIDNFLSNELYNKIINLRRHNKFKVVDSYVKERDNVYEGLIPNRPTKNSLLLQPFKNIDSEIKQTINVKLKSILPEQYYSINDLIKCNADYKYGPHKDHSEKKVSIVTFLHPLMSNATVLCKDSVEYKLQWKPNRALIFTHEEHGIHYYKNDTMYPRLTLNTYITTRKDVMFNVKNF